MVEFGLSPFVCQVVTKRILPLTRFRVVSVVAPDENFRDIPALLSLLSLSLLPTWDLLTTVIGVRL